MTVVNPGGASTVTANAGTGTFTVKTDPGYELGSVRGVNSTVTVKFDPGYTLGKVDAGVGTFTVKTDPGYELGSIKGINSTVAVYFDRGNPGVLANTSSTLVIPQTASGTASGVSVSGNTIIAPTTGRSFKVYAYSLTTTAVSSVVARFTNGAGTSPTEFWRVALQSPASVAGGANLAVQPPGYLFATGVTTTLSILIDSGIIFHYSVAYFEESA